MKERLDRAVDDIDAHLTISTKYITLGLSRLSIRLDPEHFLIDE